MNFLIYHFFVLTCLLAVGSCTQVEYNRSVGNQYRENITEPQEVQLEKPEYKVVYRKSNLEALSLGRNRIEIQELMGEPDGKSLDGGNGDLWDYRRPVFDELSEETYGWSLISFKFLKGLCAYVNIRLEQLPPEIIKLENLSN